MFNSKFVKKLQKVHFNAVNILCMTGIECIESTRKLFGEYYFVVIH